MIPPPPKGCAFKTTSSGLPVATVHYCSDPAKDTDTEQGVAWRNRFIRENGFVGGIDSPKWQREMEIKWRMLGKGRVWPHFQQMREAGIEIRPPKVEDQWPLYGGYDFGNTNPFAFIVVAFEDDRKAYQIEEITKSGLSVYKQAELIRRSPYFNRLESIYGDPSIWDLDQNDGPRITSVGDILETQGVSIIRGKKMQGVDIGFIQLLDSVLWQDISSPRYMISSVCKRTLKEFEGLHYKQWASKQVAERSPRPEEIYSRGIDCFDAVKYLMMARWAGEAADEQQLVPHSIEWHIEEMQARLDESRYVFS